MLTSEINTKLELIISKKFPSDTFDRVTLVYPGEENVMFLKVTPREEIIDMADAWD